MSGCLITKWSAVWLVHADKTRSHVGYPTTGCESFAYAVSADNGLAAYPKAHDGVGAYFLDEAQSAAACKLDACDADGKPRPATRRTAASSATGATVTPKLLHPMVPLLGWGVGVSSGGAWMQSSSLRFNGPAQKAFPKLQLGPGEPLLLVFGGASVTDMLKNWVLHVQRVQNGAGLPYVVACMDDKLFGLAESEGFPAVLMSESAGGESQVSTRWKYYRMDPKAFLAMGILKVRFFMEFMRAGFDVLCSDLDVIWLGDPRPWVLGSANSSSLLGLADVVVSTDVTHAASDKDDAMWGVNGEMNTGMVLLRSTEGAMVFCRRWKARMEQEMVKVARLNSGMVQWWTNDQTFFNEVVHSAPTVHAAQLKSSKPDAREFGARQLRAASPSPARLAQLERALRQVTSAHAAGPAAARQMVETMRGLVFKRVGCRTHEPGANACLQEGQADQLVTITTFPYLHFASGHTYFTQSLQDRLGFTPVSVHTTFQFGDTPEFTWGKRNRLRERRLWLVDEESYYDRRGPGTDPNEVTYSGYLQLTGTLVELDAPVRRTESSSSIKIEGDGSYSDRMHRAIGVDVFGLDEGNPNKHLLLDAFQRRLVMNAVALGRALKRKVIMPKMTCWCDRYWWLLEGCRFPGVPREQHEMPFHCPFDHVYDLEKWVHSDVPMREYSFLNNSRVRAADREDVVEVSVEGASPPASAGVTSGTRSITTYAAPASASAAAPGAAGRTLRMSVGDNYPRVGQALKAKGWSNAYVLRIDARSLELLCEDLGSGAANREFNQLTHRVLGVAEQIRYCDRKANTFFDTPLRGGYDQMRNPINCTWGFHRPPLLPEGGARCAGTKAAMLEERMREATRSWTRQGNYGMFTNYHGAQVWSTNDRVTDLYRQYI